MQTALSKEKQRCQGAAKACNHARSALTQKVSTQNATIFNLIKRVLIAISGQLRNLGLIDNVLLPLLYAGGQWPKHAGVARKK